MHVIITGGAGFLGRRLAAAVLAKGQLAGPGGPPDEVTALTLVDLAEPADRALLEDPRVRVAVGDIADPGFVGTLLAGHGATSLFHLAAVVSAQAEGDFDLAMRVNVDAVRALLEAARSHGETVRFVSTSSVAVLGSDAGPVGGEDSVVRPETTYGMTKALLELWASDYARKGFVDARVGRLPTVIIRPGAPNGAASSAASAVFREPLAGTDYVLPVSLDVPIAVSGVRSVVEGLVALHDVPAEALGRHRTVAFPSVSVTFADMVDALRRAGAGRRLGTVAVAPDPRIEAILRSWPARLDGSRALALGLPPAQPLAETIDDYLRETA